MNTLHIPTDWVSCELRVMSRAVCEIIIIDFGGHSPGMRRAERDEATRQVSQTRTRSALGPKRVL